MARELAYTSARQGILPGSHGFCTVAMSQGMPVPMRLGLEALTGYRTPPWEPSIEASPVEYLHATIASAGQRFHILGGVRAAAPDHSGRRNKFAHFIVLERGELDPNGPVALLRTDEVIRSSWNGAPELLPTHRVLPPAIHRAPAICRAWEAVAGDAGWAGALASDFILDGSKPTHIIMPRGTDGLQLVDEAMALLPPEWRWRITFSTYWQRSLPNHTCAWRFLFDGTEEADETRQRQARVLDLCAGGPCPREGRYVEAARSGLLAIPDVSDSFPDEEARRQHHMRTMVTHAGGLEPERVDAQARLQDHEPVDEASASVPSIIAPSLSLPASVHRPTRSHGAVVLALAGGAVVGGVLATAFVWVALRGGSRAVEEQLASARADAAHVHEEWEVSKTTVARVETENGRLRQELSDRESGEARQKQRAETAERELSLARTDLAKAQDALRELRAAATLTGQSSESGGARAVQPETSPPSRTGEESSASHTKPSTQQSTTTPTALRVVEVPDKEGASTPLDVPEPWTIELRASPELLAKGLVLSGAELRSGDSPVGGARQLVASASREGGRWVWTRHAAKADFNFDSLGGYDGMLRGLWLVASDGSATQTIALELGPPRAVDVFANDRAPTKLALPPWVQSVRIVGTGSAGAAVDHALSLGSPGSSVTIPLADGASEAMVVSFAQSRSGPALEAKVVTTFPVGLSDADFYKRMGEESRKIKTMTGKAANDMGSPSDRDALIASSESLRGKSAEGGPTWEDMERLRAETTAFDRSVEGDSKALEWFRDAGKNSTPAEARARWQDLTDFFAAAERLCRERLDEADRYKAAWPARQYAVVLDGYAPGAISEAGALPPGTVVLVSAPSAVRGEIPKERRQP